MLTTNQLRKQPIDGTMFVGYDEMWFAYLGMTEQANGDVLVHLDYADAGGGRSDIEVSHIDLDEYLWEE